jgi:NAD(P)-dependent dehydrogenase (short-subunit alcohol dehydrogenase family)
VKLGDKVAIVTGSSMGTGEGIARALSREGPRVAVVCRHEAEGK